MGQLMNIVGPLLLLGGAIFVVSKRCELLGLCGETGGSSGDTAAATDDAGVTSGGVDETASNLNEQGNWAGGSSKGCCVCEMQGDRVKCQRHGGAWFNPPAGEGGSNDQSVELSLAECNKGCGTTGSDKRTSNQQDVQEVKCPAGQVSTGGRCVTPSSNRTKGGGSSSSGSRLSPRTTTTTRSTSPRTGNLGEKGTVYVKPTPKAIGSASYLNRNPSYKPGGGSYYVTRSYFVDPYYVRPFTLYHRIAN